VKSFLIPLVIPRDLYLAFPVAYAKVQAAGNQARGTWLRRTLSALRRAWHTVLMLYLNQESEPSSSHTQSLTPADSAF